MVAAALGAQHEGRWVGGWFSCVLGVHTAGLLRQLEQASGAGVMAAVLGMQQMHAVRQFDLPQVPMWAHG